MSRFPYSRPAPYARPSQRPGTSYQPPLKKSSSSAPWMVSSSSIVAFEEGRDAGDRAMRLEGDPLKVGRAQQAGGSSHGWRSEHQTIRDERESVGHGNAARARGPGQLQAHGIGSRERHEHAGPAAQGRAFERHPQTRAVGAGRSGPLGRTRRRSHDPGAAGGETGHEERGSLHLRGSWRGRSGPRGPWLRP